VDAKSAQVGASASTKQSGENGSLAAGTAVNAELNQSLDSKKAKPGDSVTARVTEAVKADGKVILPKGTRLTGHVTRASARAKGDQDSTLALDFDRAVLKNGQEIPLAVSIQALAVAREATAVGGDDLEGVGAVSATGNNSGRGMVGGVAGTTAGAASGAAATVPRTAQSATGAVNSTVGGAAGAAASSTAGATGGLNASGELSSTSRGVFGLNGLTLSAGATSSTEGTLVTSAGKNVHLDSGTRMLLVSKTEASTSASNQR